MLATSEARVATQTLSVVTHKQHQPPTMVAVDLAGRLTKRQLARAPIASKPLQAAEARNDEASRANSELMSGIVEIA